MVVLRCPYCGEKIRPGDEFCSHCGKEVDRPHVDDVDTAFQDVGLIMWKIIGFVVLWFVILLVLGFVIHSVLHWPMNYLLVFVVGFVLTVVIWILK